MNILMHSGHLPMIIYSSPAPPALTHRSLCVTNTNANGLKLSAGVYIIIVHSTIINVHSTGPIYKSRIFPLTSPECTVVY